MTFPQALTRFARVAPIALAAQALSVVTPSDAQACGGLFCNAAAPVNQAAERIIFAQAGDVTTQIVEILYEGPAEQFAWVVPVPGTPDISVSSSIVFNRLQSATNPSYTLVNVFPDCGNKSTDGALSGPSTGTGGTTSSLDGGAPTVTILNEGVVGPFDYKTISVDPADQDPAQVALRWLEENGYEVGSLGADVLRPYLQNGLNLLAVKLVKGVPTGSIQPLSLTFQGSQPTIPIRPTAVAANNDMGVLVWILGNARAVSTNYKGLELNEMLIDWTNPAPTYNRVVSEAADEAGGQGFVTELAGPAAPYGAAIDPGYENIIRDAYLGMLVVDVVQSLVGQYQGYDGFMRAFSQNAAFRDELTADDFVACPDCYLRPEYYIGRYTQTDYGVAFDSANDPLVQTDLNALFTAIEDDVLGPIHDARDLFESFDYVTRLYTTMSAGEMTRDPTFDFNADLGDYSNIHSAERRYTCDDDTWTVTLPDGRQVNGDSYGWPLTPDATLGLPFNTRVLSYSTAGEGKVVTDNNGAIDDVIEQLVLGLGGASSGSSGSGASSSSGGQSPVGPKGEPEADGGLCSVSASPLRQNGSFATLAGLGLLAVASARRRRASVRA